MRRRAAVLLALWAALWLLWPTVPAMQAAASIQAAAEAAPPALPAHAPVPPAESGISPGEFENITLGALEDMAQQAGVAEIDRFLAEVGRDLRAYAPPLSFSDVLSGIWRGGLDFDFGALLRGLVRYLFGETLGNAALLGKLVALAVVIAVLQNLRGAFDTDNVGRLAQMVAYLALVALAIPSFGLAFSTAQDVVNRLVGFMQALMPALLSLMISSGAMASGGLFHPLLNTAAIVSSTLVANVVLPLILVAGVLEIAGSFTPGFKLSNLVSLLRLGSVTVVGILMSAFLGIAAVYKAAGAVSDGVALRTGKFLASTFIPVIGKMFSDAAELVFGTSALLSTAVGIAGAFGILLMVSFPLMKLAAVIITYRLAGAVIQPVDTSGVSDLLNGIANTVAMVFVAVALVGLWFFISVTILISGTASLGR